MQACLKDCSHINKRTALSRNRLRGVKQWYELVDARPQQKHNDPVRSRSDGGGILGLLQCGRPSSEFHVAEGPGEDAGAVDRCPGDAIEEVEEREAET